VATGVDSGSAVNKTRYTGNKNIDHRHDFSKFYTDGAYSLNLAGPAGHNDSAHSKVNLDHRHEISITSSGGHDHAGGLTMTYKNIDVHPSGSSAGNDLRGTHIHSRTTIAGRIGSVSGQNGNSAFSTSAVNQVGGQDPTTSGATYTGVSGTSVSPHLVVHFIIRATNPQVS
jgi:hypothetical protein